MSELFTDPKWQEKKATAKMKGRAAVRMHAQLLVLYQATPGRKCGDCVFLVTKSYQGTYFKCAKAKDSNGSATDWRKRWEACGLFLEAAR